TGEFLLVKSDGLLLKYVEEKHEFIPAQNFLPAPPKWIRSTITWDDHNKKYWFSCDSGLAQYDPATKHLNYRRHNIDHDPVIAAFGDSIRISPVFVDQKGDVIFAHWGYMAGGPTVRRYNKKLGKAETLFVGWP